jgi:hypothetical protein
MGASGADLWDLNLKYDIYLSYLRWHNGAHRGGKMRIDRLFGIVYLLLDKKNMTASELAGHFEVSVRTILRDINTLSAAGIPVYTS